MELRIFLGSNDTAFYTQLARLKERCLRDNGFMLDVVEALLETTTRRYVGWDAMVRALRGILDLANSAYAVNSDASDLEERVAPGVKQLVSEAVDAAGGSAGDHLTNAWNEAYGRQHDPVKAYSESVKAVEVALAPKISPQNNKQTLGTMIKDVNAKPVNGSSLSPMAPGSRPSWA